MPMMRGAAEILEDIRADLKDLRELLHDIARNDRHASAVARRDPIQVELYLKKNDDPNRDALDIVTRLGRIVDDELKTKLQRRASLDKSGDESLAARVATLTAEVEALKSRVAAWEQGTIRALPRERKEG